jgi:anti-sigma B factor antagonist
VGSLENFPVRLTGPCAVVSLPGEIDIGNAGQITDTLLAVLNRGVTTLVADMTATTFCACAGASALARAHQRAAANQAQLRVAATAPAVRRILVLTGVDRLVPMFDSVAAALAAERAAASAAPGAAGGAAPGSAAGGPGDADSGDADSAHAAVR